LRGVSLAGTRLRKACLARTDLRSANLIGAVLTGGGLREAWLDDANIDGAKLRRVSGVRKLTSAHRSRYKRRRH
jgi:uncharacterized protein YjbI with pentapeptide repeats